MTKRRPGNYNIGGMSDDHFGDFREAMTSPRMVVTGIENGPTAQTIARERAQGAEPTQFQPPEQLGGDDDNDSEKATGTADDGDSGDGDGGPGAGAEAAEDDAGGDASAGESGGEGSADDDAGERVRFGSGDAEPPGRDDLPGRDGQLTALQAAHTQSLNPREVKNYDAGWNGALAMVIRDLKDIMVETMLNNDETTATIIRDLIKHTETRKK